MLDDDSLHLSDVRNMVINARTELKLIVRLGNPTLHIILQ